jgi:hypothetical protein
VEGCTRGGQLAPATDRCSLLAPACSMFSAIRSWFWDTEEPQDGASSTRLS